MIPTNPYKTYTHKSSKRGFRLSGIEKLEDTEKWVNGRQKYKWVFNIIYLDNKEFECWLIGYDDEFIKVVKCKGD